MVVVAKEGGFDVEFKAIPKLKVALDIKSCWICSVPEGLVAAFKVIAPAMLVKGSGASP